MSTEGVLWDTTIVKPNQKVYLFMGDARPAKYHAMMECNPDLFQYGTVQFQRLAEPGDSLRVGLFFKADRQLDVSELPWVLRLYMID